jgi:hypothetical protein
MALKTLDDAILPGISNSSNDCFVGIKFADNYIGIMNEISFFLDEFDPAKIVNNLFIEASTDDFD